MAFLQKKYIYLTPLFYSVGNAAEEIYWGHIRALTCGLKVVVIAPYDFTRYLWYDICNKELFRLSIGNSDHDIFLNRVRHGAIRLFVNIQFLIKRTVGVVLREFIGVSMPENWYFPEIGKKKVWPECKSSEIEFVHRDALVSRVHEGSFISIKSKTESRCRQKLREYGLRLDSSKYICLHVRDSGYHGDYDRRPYRNADIDNYEPAIEFLVKRGYYVIRLGDIKMKRLRDFGDKVIDYPFTKLKSPEMDLYLIKHCSFYIGMQSGVLDVAMLFEKPILILNMYDWFFGYPLKVCDRGLLKKMILSSGDEVSGIEQRVGLPFAYNDWRSVLNNDDAIFLENDPVQILSSVKRFEAEYQSGFKLLKTTEMIARHSIYRSASDVIFSDPNHPFFTHKALNVSRIMLRNIASKGALYEF